MQVSGVEDDSRALNIVIHKPSSNPHAKPLPILQANFIFADHIRCIIAKQRLAKGRIQARRMKMQRIAGEGWKEVVVETRYLHTLYKKKTLTFFLSSLFSILGSKLDVKMH